MSEILRKHFLEYLKSSDLGHYPAALYEPVDYILENGGKRLRPVLLMMGHGLFAEDHKDALPAALAVEVFHNFTLLHDDIMDEAPLRRGKETVHKKYGLNAGILSGDVMMIKSYELLLGSKASAETKEDIMKLFSLTARQVCEGQQLDMDFETREDVELPEYLQMIEWKTAVLIAAALEIGARLGGATTEDAAHLYEFGRNMGLAFQVQDDLLDTFGDPEKFGKRPGGDILQNKKTFLILSGLELANSAQAKELQKLYYQPAADPDQKVSAVKEWFLKLGVPEQAKAAQEQYRRSAHAHLAAVDAPEDKKSALADLAESLIVREV
ncbi:MAG: polyprenyl synthetase family protein [Bacteroidetes bacterium]|nr:polyprenyl synthetase family protein [Bacteroidota bacterium]